MKTWLSPNGIGLFLTTFFIVVDLFLPIAPWNTSGRSLAGGPIGVPVVAAVEFVEAPSSDPNLFHVYFPWRVHWPAIVAIPLAAYFLAMPIGRLVSGGWGRSSELSSNSAWDSPTANFFKLVALGCLLGVELGSIQWLVGGDRYLTWLYAVAWTTWLVMIFEIPLVIAFMARRRIRQHSEASKRGFLVEPT